MENLKYPLSDLFKLVALFAVLFAVIRIGLQIGLFTIPAMAALGCLGLIGVIKWLMVLHEIKIESGERKQFDKQSMGLFATILGLVWLFLQLLPYALRLVQLW